MSAEKKAKCCECGGKLSTYELVDNIYAGLIEKEYICYACQSNVEEILKEDTNFDDEDEG